MTPTELSEKYSIEIQVCNDYLLIRKSKRLPLTLTALKAIEREAASANMTMADVILLCAENGWAGFKASWVAKKTAQTHQAYDNEWLKTQDGIDKKAHELGLNIQKCSNYIEAKNMIFAFLRERQIKV